MSSQQNIVETPSRMQPWKLSDGYMGVGNENSLQTNKSLGDVLKASMSAHDLGQIAAVKNSLLNKQENSQLMLDASQQFVAAVAGSKDMNAEKGAALS